MLMEEATSKMLQAVALLAEEVKDFHEFKQRFAESLLRQGVDLLTTEEIARKYNISRRTVYRWVKEGKLKLVRRGKRLYFIDLQK